MDNNTFVSVGHIVRVHGTSGEVVIAPEFDETEIYTEAQLFYLRKRHQYMPVRPESVKPVRKGDRQSFFVKFEHITNRTEADALKNVEVFLPEDQIPQTDSDLAEELQGFNVVSEDGTVFGVVIDVLDNPAHPLLQVKDNDGAFFVPFVEAFILEIDPENEQITTIDLSELKAL
ncbi:MAG: ribosome maturation factor RimM [Balneolales bacterium]|nr:ribosome maturation factor RimM [Balneolales bacterium]